MTNRRGVLSRSVVGCVLLLFAGCGTSSGGADATGGVAGSGGSSASGGASASSTGATGGGQIGGATDSGGQTSAATGGQGTGGTTGGQAGSIGSGGQVAGGSGGTTGGQETGGSSGSQAGSTSSGGQAGGQAGRTGSGGRQMGGDTGRGGQAGSTASGGTTTATGGTGQSGGAGGQGGSTATGGQTGSTGGAGGLASACVGNQWPTADPAKMGSFQVTVEKNVGPLAGYLPDPIYGDEQQRFNVYRPTNLADSGYCHPILVWANGHTDNPEPNPPLCVVDSGANKWCGTYQKLVNQLASHGFVLIASLSTTTSRGDPLPTIIGLDWLLEQAEDPTSVYYHRLDTSHIGALGHSEGGASTCKAAADPRIIAISTVSGTSTISSLHGPALFFCGAKDTAVSCDSVKATYDAVKDQPAMFINNLAADHGSWEYEGTGGVDFAGLTGWFRVQLMGDTANRKMFYGASCSFCTDNRVQVERNALMTE